MLYVTTRNKADSYTAYRALHEGTASDGGQFVPLRLPVIPSDQLEAMKEHSFHENVAQILNIFFSAGVTCWDVEFSLGRKPVKFTDMGRKILAAELWRNTESDYQVGAMRLYGRLCDALGQGQLPTGWASIAIRIAYLFGVYAELAKNNIPGLDVAASGKDMELVMALWYAKKMGLPFGKIICGTNENCWMWDLLHKGELTFGMPVITDTPDMDVIPSGIERLIYGTLGLEESKRYLDCAYRKSTYKLKAEQVSVLNSGLFASVVGNRRMKDLIASAYSTHNYLLDPYTAISYGALQDYRAKTGENNVTLLLVEGNPAHYASVISRIVGLPEEQISNQ